MDSILFKSKALYTGIFIITKRFEYYPSALNTLLAGLLIEAFGSTEKIGRAVRQWFAKPYTNKPVQQFESVIFYKNGRCRQLVDMQT